MAAQLKRYRAERAIWHQWLAKRAISKEPHLALASDNYPYWQSTNLLKNNH